MAEFEHEYLKGKSVEELIDGMAAAEAYPGSVVWEARREAVRAKLFERELEIARLNLEAAEKLTDWTRNMAVSSIVATVIALVALLIALF